MVFCLNLNIDKILTLDALLDLFSNPKKDRQFLYPILQVIYINFHLHSIIKINTVNHLYHFFNSVMLIIFK